MFSSIREFIRFPQCVVKPHHASPYNRNSTNPDHQTLMEIIIPMWLYLAVHYTLVSSYEALMQQHENIIHTMYQSCLSAFLLLQAKVDSPSFGVNEPTSY